MMSMPCRQLPRHHRACRHRLCASTDRMRLGGRVPSGTTSDDSSARCRRRVFPTGDSVLHACVLVRSYSPLVDCAAARELPELGVLERDGALEVTLLKCGLFLSREERGA